MATPLLNENTSTCSFCCISVNETEQKKLYVCQRPNCHQQNGRLCVGCGQRSHTNSDHQFDIDSKYIKEFEWTKDLQQIYCKQLKLKETESSNEWNTFKESLGVIGVTAYDMFQLFDKFGSLEKVLTEELPNYSEQIFKHNAYLHIAFFVWQVGYNYTRLHNGIIDGKEMSRLFVRDGLATGSKLAGGFVGSTAGFAMFGPAGWVIGGFLGSVAAGYGSRYVFDVFVWDNQQQKDRNNKIKASLEMFQFLCGVDGVFDDDRFNRTEVDQQYHQLALNYHPDRQHGNQSHFQIILQRYNILLGVLKEKEKRNQTRDKKLN